MVERKLSGYTQIRISCSVSVGIFFFGVPLKWVEDSPDLIALLLALNMMDWQKNGIPTAAHGRELLLRRFLITGFSQTLS